MKMKHILIFAGILLIAILSACQSNTYDGHMMMGDTDYNARDQDTSTGMPSSWLAEKLDDVKTGEEFSIDDFEGKPVLLESFAVWCPNCLKQQLELKKLHEESGDEIISISLDTDPNEDESRVLEHINKNGFDTLYAVSPAALTQSLINDFGIGIVNAPSVPMVLVCPDQTTHRLDNGFKSKEDLKNAISERCGA